MREPWPNGAQVRKINSGPTDLYQDGAVAFVLGHIGPLRKSFTAPDGRLYPAGVFGYRVCFSKGATTLLLTSLQLEKIRPYDNQAAFDSVRKLQDAARRSPAATPPPQPPRTA